MIQRPNNLNHYKNLLSTNLSCGYSDSKEKQAGEAFTMLASLGKELGLKKIGIHYEILPIGHRTCWPHSHSIEEEMVYVVKGKPLLWINGNIHETHPGDVIFFPPGSEFNHCFINPNHNNIMGSSVELLVFGEQNIKEDKIYYPLHPLRNQEVSEQGYFWAEHHQIKLGDHQASPLESYSLSENKYPHKKNISTIPSKQNGDHNAPAKVCYFNKDLGRHLGASKIALHYCELKPGFRSSFPHAESHEEEFVFVLDGKLKVLIDNDIYEMNSGDAVAFPSGTGVIHTLLNPFNVSAKFIVSGKTTKKENRCVFPLNIELKNDCTFWWHDYPNKQLKISDDEILSLLK